MKASEKGLLREFINGGVRNFVIPIYQRNYDWKKEQCTILYDDILDIISSENKHFFGSIVSNCEYNSKIIIDGQQRLTTVNIILIATYRILINMNKNEDNAGLKRLQEMIYEQYLINKFENDSARLKLKVSKNNKEDFINLFEEDIEFIDSQRNKNRLYQNFIYFYEKIADDYSKDKYTLNNLLKALEKLVIVDIELEPKHGDDPQLIFETLNSTGKKLEQSDLIRNFLLMNLEEEQQNEIYDKYWAKIEINTEDKIEDFFKFYLFSKTYNTALKIENIYNEFRKIFLEKSINKIDISKEILKYSIYYNQITKYSIIDNDEKINNTLKNIISGSFLEYTVVIPFLFYLLDKYQEQKINKDHFLDIMIILESFLFRRFIVGEKSAELNKIFIPLGKNIDNSLKEIDTNIKEMFIAYINQYKNPSDQLFRDRLLSFDLYKRKKSEQLQHIFIELEKTMYNGKLQAIENNLQIEHIIPQTMSHEWERYLDKEECKIIKEEYLHTIGNLTITGYNQELSNGLFCVKKDIYKNSCMKLTRDLCLYDEWNLENIKSRGLKLCEDACKIWKYYKNDLILNNNNKQAMLLSNAINCTSTKIHYFTFKNKRYTLTYWIDLYSKIIELLYEIDEIIFTEKIIENEYFSKYINYNENCLRTAKKIDDFFIESNSSTQSKIEQLLKIIETLNYENISGDSFEIFLRD